MDIFSYFVNGLRPNFSLNFAGPPFRLFGVSHRAALLALAALIASLWWLRAAPESLRLAFRLTAAALLVGNEITWHLWNVRYKRWTLASMLPLHLCSLMVWASAYMLLTRDARLYPFLYFMGLGAATQALLTPDLSEHDFPHFRYFAVFGSHGLIVTAALYMTVVEGLRPTLAGLGQVAWQMNLLMLAIALVNWRLGSNYMFLARKPDTPSLLDRLGPWPIYILWMEALGLLLSLILYLPFAGS